jgi:hypothetical protein
VAALVPTCDAAFDAKPSGVTVRPAALEVCPVVRPVSAVITALVLTLSLPVAVPAAEGGHVGDWQCGQSRVIITRLGSIEVMDGSEYRAGLFEERGGALEVTWDRGGETRIVARRSGDALTLTGLGPRMECQPRR